MDDSIKEMKYILSFFFCIVGILFIIIGISGMIEYKNKYPIEVSKYEESLKRYNEEYAKYEEEFEEWVKSSFEYTKPTAPSKPTEPSSFPFESFFNFLIGAIVWIPCFVSSIKGIKYIRKKMATQKRNKDKLKENVGNENIFYYNKFSNNVGNIIKQSEEKRQEKEYLYECEYCGYIQKELGKCDMCGGRVKKRNNI